eukprot:CAMPEP_0114565806 /NCGR_PEP_ID=MMETSP0114-20121206/14520_1 /TAXON_ID=31324 /ORGANISM="Goniomonas sp, Strain m" /LENGTH=452 /DNA_ID=CAMNT_0001752105 /DNA_START=204 /DNA_END=1559 /DNA_ORIENTATION=+
MRSVDPVCAERISRAAEESQKELSLLDKDQTELLLVFLFERLDKTSRWQPYFQSLPQTVSELTTSPLYSWTETELEDLAGTQFLKRVRYEQAALANTFAHVVWPLLVELRPPYSREVAKAHFDYAAAAILSRTFDIGDEGTGARFVPLVDLFNGAEEGENNVLEESIQHRGHELCRMVALVDIEAGTELRLSYGSLTRAQVLQKYGVFELSEDQSRTRTHPDDEVGLSVKHLFPLTAESFGSKALRELKTAVLDNMGNTEDVLCERLVDGLPWLPCYTLRWGDLDQLAPVVSTPLRQFAVVMCAPDQCYPELKQVAATGRLRISVNAAALSDLMLSLLDTQLDALGHSEHSDRELLKTLQPGGHRHAAVRMRCHERDQLIAWRKAIWRSYGNPQGTGGLTPPSERAGSRELALPTQAFAVQCPAAPTVRADCARRPRASFIAALRARLCHSA